MNPRKRPDGRWEARVFVLTTEGNWKRASVYGKSPDDVETKITELKAQRDKGIPVASTAATVRDFLNSWLVESVKPNRRPTTYEGYEINVRCHINPFIGGKKLSRLGVRDVQAWIGQLRVAGRSPSSIRYAHRTLRAALNQAMRSELIARNVAVLVDLPPLDDGDDEGRQALGPMQARLLLQRAGGQRLYAAYVLGLLGLRRGEVLGLRWEDVDLDQRTLAVRQTVHRSGGSLHVGPPK
ncbi:MAG TPA: site-specific integrase, partial [Mycobacteriales bacterium]|nr:site-specific integrase [Mycobacteriales bacterium]